MKRTSKLLVTILAMLTLAATMMIGCQNQVANQTPEVESTSTYPMDVTDDVVAGGTFTGTYTDAIKNGKGKAVGAIVGFIMKETKGKCDPAEANKLIQAELDKMN